MSEGSIIGEGAESRIIKINNILKKIREKKPYRLDIIDFKLRKSRCKKEFKILNKLYENNVNVPKPFELIINKNEISFTFEYLNSNNLKYEINRDLLFKSFEEIIKMHNLDVIHGDLTTLNILVRNEDVFLIDFGLAEISRKIEDKAVDLNLFFLSIKNEHPDYYKYKDELIKLYLNTAFNSEKIIRRLENIERRGRNKI